jgi:hypothetical protein
MYITSVHDDAIGINVTGPSGSIFSGYTSGYAGPYQSTPQIANEFIAFNSEFGISHIDLQGFYNLRTGAAIDNITYTYAAIPEPSSLLLLGLGLLSVGRRRLKK